MDIEAPKFFSSNELSNEQYHSGPGVSKTTLDLIDKSPALVRWSQKAPRDEEAKTAVDTGDGLHALLLEPDRFEAEYTRDFVAPEGTIYTVDAIKSRLDSLGADYKKSASKAVLESTLLDYDPDAPLESKLRAEWSEQLGGRHVFTNEEYRRLQLMRESVMAHPTARSLLEREGYAEGSMYWRDPDTGLLCRCRPDRVVPSLNTVVDLKTTADMAKFARSFAEYRYHVQDPFYSAGYEAVMGDEPAFVFIVVSTSRSAGRYPVRVFSLNPEDRARGEREMRRNLEEYAECEASGVWPGIETMSLTDWARRDLDGTR